jgi:hypothetical protein
LNPDVLERLRERVEARGRQLLFEFGQRLRERLLAAAVDL